MEFLPVALTVVSVILAIILGVVGVQVIFVLSEFRRTLHRVNSTLDNIENQVDSFVRPLKGLGGMASGVQTGMKVFETFVGWLQKDTKQK